jgi:hypothetical protein
MASIIVRMTCCACQFLSPGLCVTQCVSLHALADCMYQGAPKFHQLLLLSRTVYQVAFPAQATVSGKSAQPYHIINYNCSSKL